MEVFPLSSIQPCSSSKPTQVNHTCGGYDLELPLGKAGSFLRSYLSFWEFVRVYLLTIQRNLQYFLAFPSTYPIFFKLVLILSKIYRSNFNYNNNPLGKGWSQLPLCMSRYETNEVFRSLILDSKVKFVPADN